MISFNCKCLAGNCIFGVGNGDTGVGCGMCSGLTTRKPEQCLLPSFWCIYCDFEHDWCLVLVFMLLRLGK